MTSLKCNQEGFDAVNDEGKKICSRNYFRRELRVVSMILTRY
jgi:hypothetical protein